MLKAYGWVYYIENEKQKSLDFLHKLGIEGGILEENYISNVIVNDDETMEKLIKSYPEFDPSVFTIIDTETNTQLDIKDQKWWHYD